MSQPPFDPDGPAAHDGIFGLPFGPDESRLVLVPVPFDATASYRRGAAEGPAAILEASGQVELHDAETGDPWRAGLWLAPAPEPIAALNVEARGLVDRIRESADPDASLTGRVNEIGETVFRRVRALSDRWLDAGKVVGIVGGDHACALGAIVALAERFPGLGILHVDAHADLRDAYEGFSHSHASIMHNVLDRAPSVARIVQVGLRDVSRGERSRIEGSAGRIRAWFDADLARARFEGATFASIVARVLAPLPPEVYVSFDVDGLDPSLCPGTGTPVPGGLSWREALYLLGALQRSGRRVVGFDLSEVAPGPRGGGIDAVVGARLLYRLAGLALPPP
jgi:agmatinase